LTSIFAPKHGSLELQFRDGSIVRIHPRNGAALYEVNRPDDVLFVRAQGKDGKTALTFPISLRDRR
jgi:hypothetical protein